MAVGFRSPLFLLGISRSPVEVKVGRGAGPLPIHTGVSESAVTIGRGAGPLPIHMGVSESAVTIGRGAGPLPIHMGVIGVYVPPVPAVIPTTQAYGGSSYSFRRRETVREYSYIVDDDNEIIELLATILPIIIG